MDKPCVSGYTLPVDSWIGLLQGTRRGDRFCGLDRVVLDADTNAARNILARLPASGSNRDHGGDGFSRTRARRTEHAGLTAESE